MEQVKRHRLGKWRAVHRSCSTLHNRCLCSLPDEEELLRLIRRRFPIKIQSKSIANGTPFDLIYIITFMCRISSHLISSYRVPSSRTEQKKSRVDNFYYDFLQKKKRRRKNLERRNATKKRRNENVKNDVCSSGQRSIKRLCFNFIA